MSFANGPNFEGRLLAISGTHKTLTAPTNSDLAPEASMISTFPGALGSQSSASTETQHFVTFEIHRSRDCRHRHRVIASIIKLAALSHDDMKDREP
jgi:hypothetical protein